MVSTATNAILLDNEAFSRLVVEEKLAPYELGGYLYAGKHGKTGWEIYRTYGPKWVNVYQARRVATQANVGGGAVVVDITVASGVAARLSTVRGANSGTNSLVVSLIDEDNATALALVSAGSAAAVATNLPHIGAANATTTASNTLAEAHQLLIAPGQKLSVFQAGAGAQNDTLTVALTLILPITATADDITWSVARSTNAGDVTLAASTISAANTLQAVLLP